MTSPEKVDETITKDKEPDQEQTTGLPAGWGIKMSTLKATY